VYISRSRLYITDLRLVLLHFLLCVLLTDLLGLELSFLLLLQTFADLLGEFAIARLAERLTLKVHDLLAEWLFATVAYEMFLMIMKSKRCYAVVGNGLVASVAHLAVQLEIMQLAERLSVMLKEGGP